jgi:MoaA/NifB/PqqE/SkfB family radical SAM enzyme
VSTEHIPTPFFATWYCTNRCNLRCSHCFVPVVGQSAATGELSSPQARRMLEHLAEADVYQIAFAGGEPLLRNDFFELSAHARQLGLTVQVATNGLLISPAVAEQLRAVGYGCVQISLDGITASSHELLRGSGTFAPTMAAIDNCRRANLPVILAVAIHRRNHHELPYLRGFAESVGVDAVKLQPVWTRFSYGRDGDDGGLALDEVARVVVMAQEMLASSPVKLTTTRGALALARTGQLPPTCCADLTTATIFENGSVSACFQDEAGARGNVARDGFVDPWTRSVRDMQTRAHCACRRPSTEPLRSYQVVNAR